MQIITMPEWVCTNTRDTPDTPENAMGKFDNNTGYALGGNYVGWLIRDYVLGTGDNDK